MCVTGGTEAPTRRWQPDEVGRVLHSTRSGARTRVLQFGWVGDNGRNPPKQRPPVRQVTTSQDRVL